MNKCKIKRYKINLIEKITLRSFVVIEVSEATMDEFVDGKGVIKECLEKTTNAYDFVNQLRYNDIKITDRCTEYERDVLEEKLEYENHKRLEELDNE